MKRLAKIFKSSLTYKVLVPIIAVMLIAAAIILPIAQVGINNLRASTIKERLSLISNTIEESLISRQLLTLSNMISLSGTARIKKALSDNDLEEGKDTLVAVKKSFSQLEGGDKINFELHDADGKLFASTVASDKIMKDLSDRWSIEEMKKTKKPFISIDYGEDGLIIRASAPIVEDRKYLGSIEMTERIDYSIKSAAKKLGVIYLVNIYPEYNKYVTRLGTDMKFNGGLVINSEDIDMALLDEITKVNLNKDDEYKIVAGSFVVPLNIKTSLGVPIGTIYLAEPADHLFKLTQTATQLSIRVIMMFVASYLVIAIAVFFILANGVLGPMKSFNKLLKDLSEGDGDLTKRLEISKIDEIGTAGSLIDDFIIRIQSTVSLAVDVANETSTSGEELSTTALQLSNNIEDQLKIVAKTEELVSDVGKNLDVTEECAIITTEDLENTRKILDGFVGSLRELVVNVNNENEKQSEVSSKMDDVKTHVKEITAVLSVISDIADQTNLLALNASIEAARAGEHGKGFAVVADEVRKLAERTQASLGNINKMAKLIVSSVNDAFSLVNLSSEGIKNVASDADKLIISGDETIVRLRKSTEVSSDVVKKTTYIAMKTKNLIDVMNELVDLSRNNQEAGQNVKLVSEHLAERSSSLSNVLGKFKI